MSSPSEAVPISIATGQQWTPLVVGGVTYKQAPLTWRQLGQLESWIKSQFPDPMATAKKMAEGLPLELASEVIHRGQEQANNPRWCLGTPEAATLLRTPAGMIEMLGLQLKKFHPELTREQVEQIVETLYEESQLDPEEIGDQAQAIALGKDPVAQFVGPDDPKATTPAETSA